MVGSHKYHPSSIIGPLFSYYVGGLQWWLQVYDYCSCSLCSFEFKIKIVKFLTELEKFKFMVILLRMLWRCGGYFLLVVVFFSFTFEHHQENKWQNNTSYLKLHILSWRFLKSSRRRKRHHILKKSFKGWGCKMSERRQYYSVCLSL